MIAATSRESYWLHQLNGGVGRQQARVLACIEARGEITRHDIAARTELPLHSVCGRVNELIAAGLLIETAIDRSGERPRKLLALAEAETEQGVLL